MYFISLKISIFIKVYHMGGKNNLQVENIYFGIYTTKNDYLECIENSYDSIGKDREPY